VKKIAAWFRKWWWALVLGVLVLAGAFAALVFFYKKRQQGAIPSFINKAREKIVVAETDLLIEKERSKAESEYQKKKLKEIEEVKDDVERRSKLADYLDSIL
jgi:hypothetical protein